MNYCGVLAGGSGIRVGGKKPKQFIEFNKKPMLYWSLVEFYNNPTIDRIIISTHESYIEYVEKIINFEFLNPNKFRVICGGDTRFHSLINVIEYIKENFIVENSNILFHEAARPMINQRIINDHLNELIEHDATNTLFLSPDTIMISDGEFVTSVPLKSETYIGQTPQGYKLDKIIDIINNEVTDKEINDEIDLCALFLRKGRRVKIVRGDENLFKVTFPKDINLLKEITER